MVQTLCVRFYYILYIRIRNGSRQKPDILRQNFTDTDLDQNLQGHAGRSNKWLCQRIPSYLKRFPSYSKSKSIFGLSIFL